MKNLWHVGKGCLRKDEQSNGNPCLKIRHNFTVCNKIIPSQKKGPQMRAFSLLRPEEG